MQLGRDYIIAVVAEGTKMGDYMTRWITDTLEMDARLTVLGHVQRGGSPTVKDRVMAYKFAVAAVDALDAGHTDHICCYNEGTFSYKPIADVANSKVHLENDLLKLCTPLSR